MLSAGGPSGIAHLGAIEVLRRENIPISCVVGTSMGAVIGSMYAVAPAADTTASFRRFTHEYERVTRAEASGSGIFGALVGGIIGAATGGLGTIALGALGGGFLGASGTHVVEHRRFVQVLDRHLGHATIEGLPISFITMHQRRQDNGAGMETSRSGSLAVAVGRSAANPFIFTELNLREMNDLDPGLDRLAAIPVSEACNAFPGARLITLTVMGYPPMLTQGQDCELVVVRENSDRVDPRSVMRAGPAFERVVQSGRDAMEVRLRGYASP
ncbi:MAG: patatin-like phospholipase family protein [Polyangiales bacterium]